MKRSRFLPLLVSLACGCGSSPSPSSLAPSALIPTPEPEVARVVVNRQDVAALVTDVIANGNIGFLTPQANPALQMCLEIHL